MAVEANSVERHRGVTWHKDCGEVVSLMRQLPFIPRKTPSVHFC
jgi:hypothetical protein